MIKMGFVLSLIAFQTTFAGELTGCLSPAGPKLLIDKNCDCAMTNSCVKFSARKTKSNYYESTDKYGNKIFSNLEKVKLKESYDLFYKIMELKASGLSKSNDIKALYISLDKLNYDVRQSLLKNHASDYTEIKAVYKSGLEQRKKRQDKITKRIENFLNSDPKPIANISKKESTNSQENTFAPESSAQNVPSEVSTNKTSFLDEKIYDESNDEKKFILKNLRPERLIRNEEDTLFEIITKSYQRSAYPVLLSP